jgi:UDP-GlcNAc:undecaprenyl-phosphate/decaprenyl-phosphate GlcNAc-1-phosphate transferase
MTTTLIPVLSALAAALVVICLVPLTVRLAHRVGAVDQPADRRIHTVATPRLGGLALLCGFLVPALYYLPDDDQTRALVVGAVLIALLGAVDDIWGLRPAFKLVGQIACAAVPVAAGLTIDHVTVPFLGVGNLGPAQYPITIIWFVALVNMINFTDGMDGLAAGISGISATTFAVLAASLNRADPAIIAASLAGVCLAFLIFNFHPARVFMGDCGSMMLGFLLAGVAISGVLKTTAAIALVVPLLVLAIPILDTSFVILKRLKHGNPVYSADRSHFHHRFFTIGWGQRRTVLALYAWCALMGGAAIAVRYIPYSDGHGNVQTGGALAVAGVGVIVVVAAIYLVYILEILKWRSIPVVEIMRARKGDKSRENADRSEELDLVCARAWPPVEETLLGGWRLRFAGGVTKRANSVLPCRGAGDGEIDAARLAERLDHVESAYLSHQLPPRFQVTASSWPTDLPEVLRHRGYSEGDRTLVMTREIGDTSAPEQVERDAPSPGWLNTWWSVDGRGGEAELSIAREILGRIDATCRFIEIHRGETVVAGGLAVIDAEWVGIYCMATLPEFRRRGFASAVLDEALAVGALHGATRAYLAVTAANEAARRLYEARGFSIQQAYSYFTK